jgi:hypothetical protein
MFTLAASVASALTRWRSPPDCPLEKSNPYAPLSFGIEAGSVAGVAIGLAGPEALMLGVADFDAGGPD